MAKTTFDDTPPAGTVVSAAFLNAINNQRHTGRANDGEGALDYAATTGSANAYAATLSPVLDAHITGMPIIVKANHSNTGAATININSLGAVDIKRPNGDALEADDIVSGQVIILIYDGTHYQLVTLAAPEVTLADFASSLGQNGYQKLPGGYIEQWGIYNTPIRGEHEITITFPQPFPEAVLNVSLTGINSAGSTSRDMWPQFKSSTLNDMVVYIQRGPYDSDDLDGFFWRVIGK